MRYSESRRNGFALRKIQVQKAERLGRLLLILALAYILLIGMQQHPRS